MDLGSKNSFFVHFDAKGTKEKHSLEFSLDQYFCFSLGKQFDLPRVFNKCGYHIIIFGHPIVNGVRSDEALLNLVNFEMNFRNFACRLDGSFLICFYDKDKGSFTIVNDRFAAFAFYYVWSGSHFFGGGSFRDVLTVLRSYGCGVIDAASIFQFLWLRRLLGDSTFAEEIKFLNSASILRFENSKLTLERYWSPNFSKLKVNQADLVDIMAAELRSAVKAHMSDGREYGLFLSGGLDSRALLAASPIPLHCYTVGLFKNKEFMVAKEVATVAGAKHSFIERKLDIFDSSLNDATDIAGMQVYNEAQFLNYMPSLFPDVDVIFLGLGLDIFLAGLYLPTTSARFLGRELLHQKLLHVPDDFENFYLENVKYRLKISDPLCVLKDNLKIAFTENLRSQVKLIRTYGNELGAHGLDSWEYMHLHNFSRHYSFPMLASVRTFMECRAPALSNGIFDLTIKMKASDKLNGDVYRRAISVLNTNVMEIKNANFDLPAYFSSKHQSRVKILKYGLSKFDFGAKLVGPGWIDRSWPSTRAQLDASPNLLYKIKNLSKCDILEDIGIFDMVKIAKIASDHVNGHHDHSVLLNLLLTISSALRRQ